MHAIATALMAFYELVPDQQCTYKYHINAKLGQ